MYFNHLRYFTSLQCFTDFRWSACFTCFPYMKCFTFLATRLTRLIFFLVEVFYLLEMLFLFQFLYLRCFFVNIMLLTILLKKALRIRGFPFELTLNRINTRLTHSIFSLVEVFYLLEMLSLFQFLWLRCFTWYTNNVSLVTFEGVNIMPLTIL